MLSLTILLIDSRDTCLPDNLEAQLGASSQARLAQIDVDTRRQQFLLGRWLMAQAAGCTLEHIEEGSAYPAYIDKPDWHASISHSGPYVALAFSDQTRFGLDIEYSVRERDWDALAKRAFSANEATWIAAATAEQREARFQRIWTLREAAFKAGLQSKVIGTEPVFDPENEHAIGAIHWRYWQQSNLHLSLAGAVPFTASIREIRVIPV